jgi:bacterioferritin-associated ferredoxin
MYVCSCRGITDGTVAVAIASGAQTVEEVAGRCGAGARCGGCWPELERLLGEHAARDGQRDTRVAV